MFKYVEFVALVALVALVADVALPFKEAVIVPALKLPEASRATMVDAVFAFVALDVTVKVDAPDWLAVNVAEPDNPVPDTPIVNVPLLMSDVSAIVPVVPGIVTVVVPAIAAALNTVVPEVEPLNVAPALPIVGVVSDGDVAKATTVPEPLVLYEVPHDEPVELGMPDPG